MNRILGLIFASIICLSVYGQRFAYVDSEYVKKRLPEYEKAQTQLNDIVKVWQKEITTLEDQIKELLVKLENDKIILTEEQILERNKEIEKKRKELQELKEKKFGPDGEIFVQQRLLVKPIQDIIWNAVQKVSKKSKYDFVFDKGDGLIMLKTNPKWDISDKVLETIEGILEKQRNKSKRKNKKLIEINKNNK